MIPKMENPSCSGSTGSSFHHNLNETSRGNKSSKQLICDECNKCFKYKSELIRHQSIHRGEKPFSCNECHKSFNRMNHLISHQRIHTGEKPFCCNECHKSFSQLSHLLSHQRIHTGEKPFFCNKCKKSFDRMSRLKLHQRMHAGEIPFFCNECKKSFSVMSSLIRHQRIHTGEKPFFCNECKKSFNQLSHLKSHQRIHTGVKPFACNKCEKHFSQKRSLKKHAQIHDDQEKSLFSETEKCITVCSHCQNSKVTVGEKPNISCDCGKTSALEDSSDRQERSHMSVSYCKLCGEGLKASACHNQLCQMASGKLGNIEKELHEVPGKDEIDRDKIPLESQVGEKFEYVNNVLEDARKELHEGLFAKDGIESNEIPSENQVSEEFDFILVKSEQSCQVCGFLTKKGEISHFSARK